MHKVICGRIILYLGECIITFLHFLSSDRRLIFTYTRMYIKPASFFLLFFLAQQLTLGLAHLIVEVSRSHTLRHTPTPSSTTLNEGSAHSRGELTQHMTDMRQTSMPSAGFKPAVSAMKLARVSNIPFLKKTVLLFKR